MEIHDRLTRVALAGEGQEGIARAVYKLTDRAAAIEDRFGNLRAWAGPDQPETYPRANSRQRERLLVRAMAAASPVRDEERLVSVAMFGGDPMGVLVLRDPDGTAGDSERMAMTCRYENTRIASSATIAAVIGSTRCSAPAP